MSPLPFNIPQTKPRLKDLLDQLKRDIFLTLNCHAVATVQSVDLDNGVLTAQMNYCKTISDSSGNQTPVNYPIMVDMPIVSLCGGSAYLSFPIAKGDQCLIFFNDRDLDNWFSGARGGQLNSPRLHSFSDGIALAGLNDVVVWDSVRALLSDGNVAVGINPSTHKARVANTSAGTLNTLLQNLITAVKGITVTTTVAWTGIAGSNPFTSGTPNNASDLSSAATALGNLLE